MQTAKKIFGYLVGIGIMLLWLYGLSKSGNKNANPYHGDDQEYFIDK